MAGRKKKRNSRVYELEEMATELFTSLLPLLHTGPPLWFLSTNILQ